MKKNKHFLLYSHILPTKKVCTLKMTQPEEKKIEEMMAKKNVGLIELSKK